MARRTTAGTIPDDLRNFDLLPNSAHVRQPVVEGLYGCSASTVWRMVKGGEMPSPHKITNRIRAWNVGELRAAAEEIALRDAKRKINCGKTTGKHEAAANKAALLLNKTSSDGGTSQLTVSDPYLKYKGIKARRAKIFQGNTGIGRRDCDGAGDTDVVE